ncbi:MAG TPA: tRNA guanosine(34) transglycosylase Tgt [Chitinophagaceae bacterium]|jgi:queuine tRNA-ribosyltransferase|nr:tRNA guanosine(34) transglycosylase Tgt [Chitinophagaceae bacterium]
MEFQLIAKDNNSKARAGILTTAHGEIETPIFMPVGTIGTVKGVTQEQLERDIQAQIILGNTYHLYLRPGTAILEKAGGLHQFMNWNKPILTDSGGFQVFSLSEIRKITEEGALFRSHIDGSKLMFTPESVMDIQRSIGADIIMAFDECTPYPCEFDYAKKSMQLTHRWLARCVKHKNESEPLYGYEQSLFPIVQGSTFPDLRRESAEFIAEMECDGNAIGGLSVGEPAEMMYEMCDLVCSILPQDKPRYLMGVGTPANILENIALGIDMFDCVMPTRNGRNGMLFTTQGIINIKNKKWEDDFTCIDAGLECFASRNYTKAYLRHLFTVNELLGLQIASLQNLSFYIYLVKEARKHIQAGDFTTWKNLMIKQVSQRL